jgi:hypothetical protein
VTLTGTLAFTTLSTGSVAAVRTLPGGSFSTPPSLTCDIASPGSTIWLDVGDLGSATQASSYQCAMGLSGNSLSAILSVSSGLAGYSYAIVVVY